MIVQRLIHRGREEHPPVMSHPHWSVSSLQGQIFAIHCPLLLKFGALSAISPFEVTACCGQAPVRRLNRAVSRLDRPLFASLSAVISTRSPCQCPELVILPAVIVRSPLVNMHLRYSSAQVEDAAYILRAAKRQRGDPGERAAVG